MIILDAIIRGGGIGLALLLCLLVARHGVGSRNGLFGVLFGLGVGSYLICSASWALDIHPYILTPLLSLCVLNPLLFWLFARSLFDDEFQLERREWAIIIGAGSVGLFWLGIRNTDLPLMVNISTILQQVVGLALVLHILYDAIQGLADDLIENRRKLRIGVIAATGAYMVLVAIAELVLAGQAAPQYLNALNAAGITLLLGGAMILMTRLSDNLLSSEIKAPATRPNAPPSSVDDEDLMARAVRKMESGTFADTTLTVASLATQLRVPEYKLRRAINQGLGYRNFNSFLNHYRIAAVKAAMADPNQVRIPILTLALDAGFNSIAPFNRAFRAELDVTPSEFRKKALGKKAS